MKLFKHNRTKNTTVSENSKPYHITLHFFSPEGEHTMRTYDYASEEKSWEIWNKLLPFLKRHDILGEHWESGLDEISSVFSIE